MLRLTGLARLININDDKKHDRAYIKDHEQQAVANKKEQKYLYLYKEVVLYLKILYQCHKMLRR